ncbi:ABC transporter substrate-binding protein [Mycobacterium sp. RTGN3]|uniref:ABC transporter substrate-binding protein n=1 Tax=Mycobacterium sp. RTGN3 TaxID=3016524 RepID=UPI0029C70212|nr:ABC transporter substrate-binding protein [Mycobacterium sp. RTGN3]
MATVYHGRQIEPYRLGVLIDLPEHEGLSDCWPDAIRFACEEVQARGLLERPVELVVREVYAQPWASAHELIRTYRELVEDAGVLGVIGPYTTDNCLSLLPEIERLQVPTATICGSTRFAGEYAYAFANGGLADEPGVIAAWLQANGHRRVAVLRERTQIGEEYAQFFRNELQPHDLVVTAEPPVYPATSVDELVEALNICRDSKPDALVYLGLGGVNQWVRPALEQIGWDPPRVQTTAFVSATYSEQRARRLEGWVGVDQYDERNEVFAAVLRRFHDRFGYSYATSGLSTGYDLGHAFALGLGRMRLATPTGLRDALDTVRRIPSCTGGPGTIITLGPSDRRAYKGADFLILRRASDGKTTFESVAPVTPWQQP